MYVVGRESEAAMIRENKNDFRSNIALGGHAIRAEITNEIKTLCIDVSVMLGLDFCGIDILMTPDGPLVCEVNANALFTSLNDVCGVHIGHRIADHVISSRTGSL